MNAPTDLLPVVPAAQLDALDPERRWLIDGLWPRTGVGIIGGAPKCWKSWLGIDIAFSVASATPCLDRFEVVEPGPALVYLAEDPPPDLKDRLLCLCTHRHLALDAIPLNVITAPVLRLDIEADRRRLAHTVAHYRPRLLLLDPFVRLHRLNENDSGDISALLGHLRELQRAHDLTIAIVHHARKNATNGSGGESLRGSSDFYAFTDALLYLRRHKDRRILSVEHRAAAGPTPIPLALANPDSPTTHLAIVDDDGAHPEPRSDHRTDADLERAILAALDDADGAMTRDQIRNGVSARNQRISDALARLAEQGLIVRHADRWARANGAAPVPALSPPAREREH